MKIAISLIIVGVSLFFILLNYTNPLDSGPFAILMLLVSLYIALVGLLQITAYVVISVLTRLAVISERALLIIKRRSYYYSSIIGLLPILLLAAQSIRSFQLFDTFLVLAFGALALFYVEKKVL